MKFVAANNITLCVKRDGSRHVQPIVFINSLGSDYRIWDDVLPLLPGTYDFIRYDLRGHGLSDCPQAPYSIRDHANDLADLLDALAIENPVLVGISVGGMIAIDYAAAHPGAVKALVLLDTFPKIGTEPMWNERINTLREHGMAHLTDQILSRWFAPSFAAANPTAYQGYSNMLSRMPVMGYTGTCEAIRDTDLTESARTIDCPALVLCGAEDGATPPDLVRGLVNILPNARYAEIANAGHLPCVENPATTAHEIHSFLKGMMPDDKYAAGMKVRREVLGDAHVDRAEANKTAFDTDFQRMITEMAWGTVWTGEDIDRQTRHLLVIAVLAALGKEHELAMHLKATLNTGVTPEQIKEVFHVVAIYAGVPAANTAFGIAKRVFNELNIDLDEEIKS